MNRNNEYLSPPFHTGTAIRVISGFWCSHGHINPGSIRVRPGSNPGYRSGSGAGFRSGITIRLRHNRISSVRKWRRKANVERSRDEAAVADMERGEDSEPASGCSAERQRLPHDCRRPSKARLSAHVRLLLLLKRILRRCLIHAMDNSPKQRKITIIAVAAILSCTNERSVAMCLSLG